MDGDDHDDHVNRGSRIVLEDRTGSNWWRSRNRIPTKSRIIILFSSPSARASSALLCYSKIDCVGHQVEDRRRSINECHTHRVRRHLDNGQSGPVRTRWLCVSCLERSPSSGAVRRTFKVDARNRAFSATARNTAVVIVVFLAKWWS